MQTHPWVCDVALRGIRQARCSPGFRELLHHGEHLLSFLPRQICAVAIPIPQSTERPHLAYNTGLATGRRKLL